MEKSLTAKQNPGSHYSDQPHDKSITIPAKLIALDDSHKKKDHTWFITSHIPTDLAIQVQEITFNVHKYPLVAKCGYIGQLDLQPSISKSYDLKLENLPGGSETFEMILKFCYGLPVDLNPNNIAPLRCASEFLEMTEELEAGNLISKTESFLTLVVLSSWKDTITVLKSCETLSPWAENLQVVRRCCDSIAWKVSRENIKDTDYKEERWFHEVATLRIDHFMRIISAIKAKCTKPEFVGKCIMHYAERWLPGMDAEFEGLRGYGIGRNDLQFSILSSRKEEVSYGHSKEQKEIIESLLSILPFEHVVPCKFLLQMLKMAMVYSASPALISELEKRAGMMLEDATVTDLLIPSYNKANQGQLVSSPEECTIYDIDVVQRIVEYFLMHEQQQQGKTGKVNVSKLLDNYLAEIAGDPNLSITKFQVLAELLPENTRTCDDGLYRAIDIFLKTHPSLPDHERRRLCRIMNCEKLSLDGCMHAAQNDRLPMRTIVQVLFSEQVKMRTAILEKEPAPNGTNSEQQGNHSSTDVEIKNLKGELESVKIRMAELQSDYSELQQEYEKINIKQKNVSAWSSGWRKIKRSFHTKSESSENGGGQSRPSSIGCRITLRRRNSMP